MIRSIPARPGVGGPRERLERLPVLASAETDSIVCSARDRSRTPSNLHHSFSRLSVFHPLAIVGELLNLREHPPRRFNQGQVRVDVLLELVVGDRVGGSQCADLSVVVLVLRVADE